MAYLNQPALAWTVVRFLNSTKTLFFQCPFFRQAFEGDAYPIGALAVGTVVHNVEKIAGKGGEMACVAGAYGTILRKEGDRVIVSFYRKKRYRAIVHNQVCEWKYQCRKRGEYAEGIRPSFLRFGR